MDPRVMMFRKIPGPAERSVSEAGLLRVRSGSRLPSSSRQPYGQVAAKRCLSVWSLFTLPSGFGMYPDTGCTPVRGDLGFSEGQSTR